MRTSLKTRNTVCSGKHVIDHATNTLLWIGFGMILTSVMLGPDPSSDESILDPGSAKVLGRLGLCLFTVIILAKMVLRVLGHNRPRKQDDNG